MAQRFSAAITPPLRLGFSPRGNKRYRPADPYALTLHDGCALPTRPGELKIPANSPEATVEIVPV
jgi:hypothetical protein